MENANTSCEESLKLLEAADKHARGVGVKNGLQNDKLIRLMPRDIGNTIQFEIVAKEGGRVCVVGMFNKWAPTMRPPNHDPDTIVFRATLLLPFGIR